jgi:hypothetical protein
MERLNAGFTRAEIDSNENRVTFYRTLTKVEKSKAYTRVKLWYEKCGNLSKMFLPRILSILNRSSNILNVDLLAIVFNA